MTPSDTKRVTIRFPPDLAGILEKRAREHERSFHGEVMYLLRWALAMDEQPHHVDTREPPWVQERVDALGIAGPADDLTPFKPVCNCGFRPGKDKKHAKWCPAK